jgi:hypothetical protein
MCQGKSHFSQKWPLANVGESGKSSQHGLANVGESGESSQKCLANVGESGEYLPSLGKCRPMIRQVVLGTNYIFFMYKTIYPTLAKFAILAKFAKFAYYLQNLAFASLASPRKLGWRMSASLVSPSKPGWQM